MNEEINLKRILIFDDDADLRKLLLVYLGKMFDGVDLEEYDPLVLGAPDESFDWSKYDVLILDYFLCIHGVTGLDILHTNRKNLDFPPTIMLTEAGNEEVAVRALKSGVSDYLKKQSLDKEELKTAIIKAYTSHQQQRERKKESTQQGKAFNKSLFYQQLEFHKDLPGYRNRVLLYLDLADNQTIVEREGVILRDNIVRHIAKQSFEIFSLGECNPSITRLGDTAIALLIDMPDSLKTLEFNLNGLLNHLKKRPFKFDDREINFAVNIGVVELYGDGEPKEIILKRARAMCQQAAESGEVSFKIYVPIAKQATTQKQTQHPVEKKAVSSEESSQAETTPVIEEKTDKKPGLEGANLKSPPPPQATDNEETKPVEDKPVAPKATPTQEQKPVSKVASQKSEKPVPVKAPSDPAPNKPKKSIEELKAELEKAKIAASQPHEPDPPPPQAPETPAVSTAAQEINLDIESLDEESKGLYQSLEEKRIILSYQPVISLLNEEVDSDDEIHAVGLLQADNIASGEDEDLRNKVTSKELKMYIDRWILREIIGALSIKENIKDSFIIDISDASLADASFFNWFRKMLTGLDSKNLGKYLLMEINKDHLITLEKQVSALISYLRKTHDFSFVLGNIKSTEEIITFTNKFQFDIIRCNFSQIKELQGMPVAKDEVAKNDENATQSHLDLLKSKQIRFIADDISDATSLTDAISIGAEYAMGEFIGEPVTQVDDETNIESFEIV